MVNTTETAAYIKDGGSAVLVNVQSATVVSDGGVDLLRIQATGIPGYSYSADQALVDELNTRPLAETDFLTGATTISAGDTVEFGQDIGLSSNTSCTSGAGYGYWPPGPECPSDIAHDRYIPLIPTPAAEGSECETGLGNSGLWVNGTSIFNWGDGFAYDDDGVWVNLAAAQEIFDLDICAGHAAAGEYHHHSYSRCIASEVGDDGSGHSPVYGVASDGYPIYGPWFSDGVYAESCWVARDYDDPTDSTGCGGTGERTCLMVDQYDPTLGTTAAGTDGPTTSEIVYSLSGNSFSGADPLFYQDHYYSADCHAHGGRYLDEHNGHDHDDLGYHYHVTMAFPWTMGPTLYGEIHSSTEINCDGISVGGGPPG